MNLKKVSFLILAAAFLTGALYLGMIAFGITALPIHETNAQAMTTGQWIGVGIIRALLILAVAGAYGAMVSFTGIGFEILRLSDIWDKAAGKWIALLSFAVIFLSGWVGAGYFMIARPVI